MILFSKFKESYAALSGKGASGKNGKPTLMELIFRAGITIILILVSCGVFGNVSEDIKYLLFGAIAGYWLG